MKIYAADAPKTISKEQRDAAQELLETLIIKTKGHLPVKMWKEADEIFHRVEKRLDNYIEPTEDYWTKIRQLADDILANDPAHQDMLRRFERDRVLREKAFSHMDALMHLRWSLYPADLRKVFKEPQDGVLNEGAWDEWMESTHVDHLKSAKDELQKQRRLLDGAFERYKNETWGPKQPSVVVQGRRRAIINGVIQ